MKYEGQETDLEVVWKLLSTSIPGVHRDEHGTGWVQHQLSALKEEPCHALIDSYLNALDLLCDHRQHLQLNAVEFVEARPSTGLGQTFEELAHCFVVKAIGTVEHHTLKHTTVQVMRR